MKVFNPKALATAVLITLLATTAYADPHSGHERKTQEEQLATLPGLTQAQRDDIVRIEKENREAQRALMESTRTQHEQLRDQATQKLRTALGDKAYATYVTWKLEQRGQHRGERRRGRMGQRPSPPAGDQEMEPAAGE
ncbi:MAG: hypothetical protein ABIR27_00245 [Dokdonella sp.]